MQRDRFGNPLGPLPRRRAAARQPTQSHSSDVASWNHHQHVGADQLSTYDGMSAEELRAARDMISDQHQRQVRIFYDENATQEDKAQAERAIVDWNMEISDIDAHLRALG
ncbi:uncharacterized protein JCM6883_004617 [Sporobolomyces salmoneus]|uniref:uncharacterized protein n=1 Tax=Sporobolomyces salmoneus TaxID=183962 RepID=UPI00316D6B32